MVWYFVFGRLCYRLLFIIISPQKGKSPYNKEQVLNLMTFQILGVLLGGRIGFVLLYRTEEFFNDPLMIFYVWQGGWPVMVVLSE